MERNGQSATLENEIRRDVLYFRVWDVQSDIVLISEHLAPLDSSQRGYDRESKEQQTKRVDDALLTSAASNDSSPPFLLGELLHEVVGTTQLEREDGSEILALEQDLRTESCRELQS